jgi:hypothetical protein
MEVGMRYQITGLQNNQLWFAYAKTKLAAEHVAGLFRGDSHTQVTVIKLPVSPLD